MTKLSKNKKLNYVLNDIYSDLMDLGVEEIARYKRSFQEKLIITCINTEIWESAMMNLKSYTKIINH